MSIFNDIANSIKNNTQKVVERANEDATARIKVNEMRGERSYTDKTGDDTAKRGFVRASTQTGNTGGDKGGNTGGGKSGKTGGGTKASTSTTGGVQEDAQKAATPKMAQQRKATRLADEQQGTSDVAATRPITINVDSVANYEDASDEETGSKKGKPSGKSKNQITRNARTFAEANARAQEAIRAANQLQPEEVAYEPAEMSYLYNSTSKQRSSKKKGKGKKTPFTKEQKRQLRADAMSDAIAASRSALDSYQQRKAQANTDVKIARGRAIANAMGRLNEDRRARINEILENASMLNDGAQALRPGQMDLLGTSQEELDALGLSDLVPPEMLYDGIPDAEYVKPGDSPYLAYRRRDDAGSTDALDWLIEQVDKEVADKVSVFREQASDEDLASFQDYANGVKPAEIGSRNTRAERLRDSRVQTQMAWLNPMRMFKGLFKAETKEEQGFEYVMGSMSKEAMNAVDNVSLAYHGLSINSSLKLVMARGGIAYDNFAKMKPEIRDAVVIELCKDIVMSERINGLPNNIVTGRAYDRGVRDDKGILLLGGTRCFPFGYIPNDVIDEIRSIPGNKISDMTKEQIRKMEWEQFINNTYPNIFANATKAQLAAYQNGMTALLELDGQNPNYFDIPRDDEMTIQQQLSDVKDIDDPAVNQGTVVTAAATHRAAQKAEARHRHTPHTRMAASGDSNRNGHTVSVVTEGVNALDNTFKAGANYIRANAAENLLVMGSGIPENALAAAENWEVNWLGRVYMDRLERKGVDIQQYLPTDYIISQVRSSKGREALDVMSTLYHMDGMGYDMVALYQEKGYSLNKADLAKFVNELRGMEGKFADFNAMLSNMEHFWSRFALGEGLFQKSDAQQWSITMLQMMAEAQARGSGAGVFNAKQMEDAISVGGIEQFITDMMYNSEVARDAFMFIGLNSFNAKNPYTHAVERLFKANGFTQIAFTAFVNKFPTYGVTAVTNNFPLFNSVSYIVNTMTSEIMDWAGFSNAALNLRNYQAGARSAIDAEGNFDIHGWFDGLRRNFMYDAVHHGNKMMMTICMYTVIGALGGLGLPDDKDKYGVLEEYRIGGANGLPVKYAWWLDDIMGLTAPAAYALWLKDHGAYDRQGNWHEIDSDTYTDVFWNGAVSHVNGTAIFATIEMIRDLDVNMELITQMMSDPESYAARLEDSKSPLPGSPSEAMEAFVEHYLVANLMRDVTPTLVRQLLPMSKGFIFRDPDSDAHTAWSVWETDPTAWNPSGKTKQEAMNTLDTKGVGYLEGRRRQDSQDNPLYALYNNLVRNGWGIGDILNGGVNRQETGYFYDQQALSTKADDRAMMYLDMFWLDPMNDGTFEDEDGNPIKDPDERRQKLNEKAIALIDYMEDNWQTADEAVANGFVLPYGARINAGEYCWYMYNSVKDQWKSMKGTVSNDEYWNFKDEVVDKAYKRYIQDLYYGWHLGRTDDTIPSTAPKYVRQESDYIDYYVDDEGNAANWMDYLKGDATRETYAFGNPKNQFMPWAQPRTEGKGFNEELTPYWDIPGYTDYEKIAEELSGNLAKMGLNAGEDLKEVYFGGQPDGTFSIPTDGSMQTTIDLRNYRKSDLTEIPEVLRNATKDSVEDFLGVKTNMPFDDDGDSDDNGSDDTDDTNGTNGGNGGGNGGGYYRRGGGGGGGGYTYYGGGGGGGGSSYNPRIYSNARQVYSSRPSGMSTRSPYKATSTYLRPGFYTSGSRKSYSRQN